MSELKATPGPWYFSDCPDSDETLEITADSREEHVAIATIEIGFEGPIESEQQANAHLIAAAPELYAACLAALEEDSGMYCTDQLRAALAKARGEA